MVFAGTHNSFSAADSPGWFIANQRHTIRRQLEDGIRLFLIDPHWGVEAGKGKVRTDFGAEDVTATAWPQRCLRRCSKLQSASPEGWERAT